MAAEDERCGNAANYAYDTMIGLFSTCVFRPPFLDSHEECEVLYNEIYSARGSFTRRMRLPDGDRGLTELLDLGYDCLLYTSSGQTRSDEQYRPRQRGDFR